MVASTVLQAVQSCHELLLWMIPQVDKFPRACSDFLARVIQQKIWRLFTMDERMRALNEEDT